MASSAIDRFRIVRAHRHRHVTDDVVHRLEEEMWHATGWPIEEPFAGFVQRVARGCAAASLPFPMRRQRDVFMVMMGPYRVALNAADWLATSGRKVAWMFDVWPNAYQDLADLVKRYKIDALFITSKQSADRLSRAVSGCDVKWCPEPLVDLGFRPKPFEERKTEVIQFGRRYGPYHDALVNDVKGIALGYVFEKRPGDVIYPTKTEFVIGLGDSKVSVCFSSDMTHPERAGDVSTTTQRYLQSFASGCIVLGNTPPELIQLFGYDPVVPANMRDPVGQIAEVLAFPEKYLPLVERNMKEVRNHTVKERAQTIMRELG